MLKDAKSTAIAIENWIKQYFIENGPHCKAVIGLSGGKDSTVAAALCVAALGKERVVGVLMPNGIQSDIADAQQIAGHLGIQTITVNIKDSVEGLKNAMEKGLAESDEGNEETIAVAEKEGALPVSRGKMSLSRDTLINLPARIRMATLYAIGQSLPEGARVVNTCNRSENYVGYSTKYGDAAGDFSPLGGLLVEEVRQIGEALALPMTLVHKAPSDGLSGQTDEDKLGFTYAQLDHYILTGECSDADVKAKIDYLHRINLHKLRLMPEFAPE